MKNVKLTETAHKQLNDLRDKVLKVETQSAVIDHTYKSICPRCNQFCGYSLFKECGYSYWLRDNTK